MGTRVYRETFASQAEAEQGAKRLLLHAIPGYSERYVRRGPEQYLTADGRERWFVEIKEYYG